MSGNETALPENAGTLDLGILVGAVTPRAGGLFHSVRLPANRLAAEGHRVTVYSVDDAQVAGIRGEWAVGDVKVFLAWGPLNFGYSPSLGRSLVEARHDVLHQHGIWMHQSTAMSAWQRRHGRPTVISPRGMLDPWAVNNSAWKKRIAGYLFEHDNLRRATCLHALNMSEAVAIRAFGLRNPIAVIPNGVDLPEKTTGLPRPEWLPDDGRRVLMFLGRIHPKKGLSELLDAWALVARRSPPTARSWRLVLGGWDDGGHVEALAAKRDGLGLSGDVLMPGALHGAEKAAALAAADAFILPSHSEGLPVAVLEAWAFGLPVFMTRACNLPEAFDQGAAQEITVDPRQLADQLVEGLDDDAKLRMLGSRGNALVRTRFTWADVTRRQRQLYSWLTQGGPMPEFVLPAGA